MERLKRVKFFNKNHDKIFKLIFIEWTKNIKAGGDSLSECYGEISELEGKQAKVVGIIRFLRPCTFID